jgi:hypothetical protein
LAQKHLKSYLQPAFLVCAGLLLTAAIAKETVIRALGVHMVKEPIPLQHPLDEMDPTVLAPYELKERSRIQNRDVLESLGTEEYMQWILEDTEASPGSPTRYCSLFITYYTGNPDMVPHVPDECYVGGGNARTGGEMVTLEVPGAGRIPFQNVMFQRTTENLMKTDEFSVQYFFHANGKYSGSRTDTRLILGSNWFNKYSYFCKVEWKFYSFDSFGMLYPEKEQTLEASRKLLERLLPELEKNHWPNWDEVNSH